MDTIIFNKQTVMVVVQKHLRPICSLHSTAHYNERESILTCLTQAHRDQIFGMLLVGQQQAALARHFGVSRSTVSHIVGHLGQEVS